MIVLLLTKVAESLLQFLAIITILSDFGTKDGYIAILKASIDLRATGLQWVDLSHHIDSFNQQEAAYVLKQALPYFPAGTIHLVAMENHSEGQAKNYIAVAYQGQFLFLADNGLLTLLSDEGVEQCVLLGEAQGAFGSLEIFKEQVPAFVAHQTLSRLGPVHQPIRLLGRQVRLTKNEVVGTVMYTDHFGNLHTNITRDHFERFRQDRSFYIKIGRFEIQKLGAGYASVPPGELVVFWNSTQILEIAINEGRAANLLGLKTDSPIFITYNPEI